MGSVPSYQRIFVTGSGGVLGYGMRSIRQEYPGSEFIFGTKEDCNLLDLPMALERIRFARPDALVHLAAVSGGVVLSKKHPASLLRDSVLMTVHVLEIARTLQIPKVVMTLSGGMYPPSAPLPIKEESIHDGPAHESNDSYAYAKRLIEPAIRAYRSEFGVNAIGLVPNGIFGPGDKFTSEAATFIAALIQRFFENRDNDSPIVVWGDGSPLRQVTFSDDMARSFLWALFHYDGPEILNVGTPEEHSIREIAWMLADELSIDRQRIVFDPAKPGGVFRKGLDVSKFLRLSQFHYAPLRTGLRRTFQWLRDHDEAVLTGGGGVP